MTIQEAQSKVDVWINTYGVRYFNELTNMAILTEEVGTSGLGPGALPFYTNFQSF